MLLSPDGLDRRYEESFYRWKKLQNALKLALEIKKKEIIILVVNWVRHDNEKRREKKLITKSTDIIGEKRKRKRWLKYHTLPFYLGAVSAADVAEAFPQYGARTPTYARAPFTVQKSAIGNNHQM